MQFNKQRLLLVAAVFLVTSSVNAQVLFFEDFEGTAGSNLTDKPGWSGSSNITLDPNTLVVAGQSGKVTGTDSYFNLTFDIDPDLTSLGGVGSQLIASGTLRTSGTNDAGKYFRFINLTNVSNGSGSNIYPAFEATQTDIKGKGDGGFPSPPLLQVNPPLLTDTLYDFRIVYTEGGPGLTDDTFQKEYKLNSDPNWIDAGSSIGNFLGKRQWNIDGDISQVMHLDNLKLELLTAPLQLDAIWTEGGTGAWTDPNHWDTVFAPTTRDHTATFADAITAPTTVTVDTDETINGITFNHSISYGLGGVGSLNLQENTDVSPRLPNITATQGDHQFLVVTNVLDNTTVNVASASTLGFNHTLNLLGNTLTKTGTGTILVNNKLPTTGGGTLDVQEGTIAGVGTVGGDLNNNLGYVAPGSTTGVLTIDGNYTQGTSATLAIEIIGTTAGTGHDQLAVEGDVSLDGTLDIQTASGFTPSVGGTPGVVGETYVIVTTNSRSGEFAAVNGRHVRNGIFYDVAYNASHVTLGAFQAQVGDADGDYDIDITDFNILSGNFDPGGNNSPHEWTDANFDGDNDVDITDFNGLSANFSPNGYAGASGQVPEPTTFVLLLLGLAGTGMFLRREKRNTTKTLSMNVTQSQSVLVTAVFFFAGTANAAVFTLMEEDFSGTPGANLTTNGWTAVHGQIQLDATTIDEGNSASMTDENTYTHYNKPFSEISTIGAGEELTIQWSLQFGADEVGWSRFGVGLTHEPTMYGMSFNKDEISFGFAGGISGTTNHPNSFFSGHSVTHILLPDTLYDLRTVITGGPDPNDPVDDMIKFEYKARTSETWEPPVHSAVGAFFSVNESYIDAMNSGFFIDTLSVKFDTPSRHPDATWSHDGPGAWNDAGHWKFVAPATRDDSALFGDAISSPTTVVVDSDLTINAITFDHSITYGIGGLGSLNLQATSTEIMPKVSVAQGSHQFLAVTNLVSDTTVSVESESRLDFNHALNLMGNTLTKTGGGTMSINNVLTTSGGTIVVLEGTFAGDGSLNAHVNNERGTISPGNSSSASGPGSAVPEPCGFPLLAVGLSVLLRSRRRS